MVLNQLSDPALDQPRNDAAAVATHFASPRRVLLLPHIRPDGDAMGSVLGLADVLAAQGHTVQALFSPSIPDYLAWMPGAAQAQVAETAGEAAAISASFQPDTVVCLDFGILDRSGPAEASVRAAIASGATVLHLDHHIDFEPFAHLVVRDVKASSTCELVLRLVKEAFPSQPLSRAAATCLYTGIMTDTGSFRFDSTTPAVHRAVADLLEAGVPVGTVHHRIFSNYSELRTRFLGHCLANRLQVFPEWHAAIVVITAQDQVDFQVRPGDTEGIVNYALGIRGINLGVLLLEYPTEIKMSFRSVGTFSAQAFASNFRGGGHYNAAGGRSTDSLAATEARLLALLQAAALELQYEV